MIYLLFPCPSAPAFDNLSNFSSKKRKKGNFSSKKTKGYFSPKRKQERKESDKSHQNVETAQQLTAQKSENIATIIMFLNASSIWSQTVGARHENPATESFSCFQFQLKPRTMTFLLSRQNLVGGTTQQSPLFPQTRKVCKVWKVWKVCQCGLKVSERRRQAFAWIRNDRMNIYVFHGVYVFSCPSQCLTD